MTSLFDPGARDAFLKRFESLEPAAARRWGTMEPAQMLAHCAVALEAATGDRPTKQSFLGRLVTPFIRSRALGEGPVPRNLRTDPSYVVSDARDFATERARLVGLVDRFCAGGPAGAGGRVHCFFGALSGEEWGRLVHKHLDHHLRQFGA